MTLELQPQAQYILVQEAEREGISVDELIVRHFAPAKPTNGAAAGADPDRERIFGKLRRMREQYGPPLPSGGHKPLSELSAQWAAEDAHLSDAERQADRDFWEDFSQRERQPVQI
jgi:hypothetical protein